MSNHTYEFTSLENIINQFIIAYVGEDKIISKIKRLDVAFHAKRALQELSFDTFKSTKSREITVPSSLQMELPEDYVNYTKISWVDAAGIKHTLYPTSKTSNPIKYQTDSNSEYLTDVGGNYIPSGELIKNGNFANGAQNWVFNQSYFSAGTLTSYDTSTFGVGTTEGDPEQGWFHGWDGNAVGGYDIVQYNGIIQHGVPIISGEDYKVTYTLSGYTSGSYGFYIVDENGDLSILATDGDANGTFSGTVTAGETAGSYPAESIMLRNRSTTDGNVVIDDISVVRVGDEESSVTWGNYKSGTPSENQNQYDDDSYWPLDGSRFGIDPQHAQANGSFYMDNQTGKIHFSSNISGKTVVLDYISDGIGTETEMVVHKFAEEAMYKWLLHAILSTRVNIPEHIVNRYKKERFAAIRQAKLRLSNIKLEEITQVLRGKSKQIKH